MLKITQQLGGKINKSQNPYFIFRLSFLANSSKELQKNADLYVFLTESLDRRKKVTIYERWSSTQKGL